MWVFRVFVVCLALAVVQGKVHWDKAVKNWKICIEETGAEENMDDVLRRDMIPTSDKGMCLMECMLRINNIYDAEGHYHREGTKVYFDELFEEQPEVVEKALSLAEECSKIDIEGLDKCEAAVKHVACGRAKFLQHKIVVNKD